MRHSSVLIMLSVKDGEKYIEEQVISFFRQTHKNWQLLVMDDGSTDNSIEIIKNLFKKEKKEKKLTIISRKNQGYFVAFRSLAILAGKFDYYAWSDQDDVWNNNKIELGLRKIKSHANNMPILYCSKSSIVNKDLKFIKPSNDLPENPLFKTSLLQNIASGHTMIFNSHSLNLFNSSKIPKNFSIPHDWLMFILVSGNGGKILTDNTQTVLYRQHKNNIIGYDEKILNKLRRFYKNNYRELSYQIYNLLKLNKKIFLAENYFFAKEFFNIKNKIVLKRFYFVWKNKLFKQTITQNILFIILLVFNRF